MADILKNNYLVRAVSGKERLWLVFWPLGVLVLYLLIPLVDDSDIRLMADSTSPVAILLTVLRIIVQILIWVAIWRCAFNVNWRGWGCIARGIVLLMIFHGVRAELLITELTI